jgi:hypothetical protein
LVDGSLRVEGVLEVFRRERLGDQEHRAGREGAITHLRRRLGRDEAERHLEAGRSQTGQQVEPVHARHVPVAQHQVGGLLLHARHRVLAVGGLDDVVTGEAGLAQGAGDDEAHRLAVVDDQYSHN